MYGEFDFFCGNGVAVVVVVVNIIVLWRGFFVSKCRISICVVTVMWRLTDSDFVGIALTDSFSWWRERERDAPRMTVMIHDNDGWIYFLVNREMLWRSLFCTTVVFFFFLCWL
jgi:hypothetical protein